MKQQGFDNSTFSFDLEEIFGKKATRDSNSGGFSTSDSDKFQSGKDKSFKSDSYFQHFQQTINQPRNHPHRIIQTRPHPQPQQYNMKFVNYPYHQLVTIGNLPLVKNSFYPFPYNHGHVYFDTNKNIIPSIPNNRTMKKDKNKQPPSKDKKEKRKKVKTRKQSCFEEKQDSIVFDKISYKIENSKISENNNNSNIEENVLILLNDSFYKKKKKCILIQKKIEDINDPVILKRIFAELNKNLAKISIGKFSNYFLQSLFVKLDSEDLKTSWKELTNYEVMSNEFGNRVIQALVGVLLSKNMQNHIISKLKTMISVLSYDKYGIFVLQSLFIGNLKSGEIDFLTSYINEFFHSLSFNINGVVLLKKYFLYIKKNDDMECLKKLYIQKIKPFFYFLIHEKYSSYLVQMLIEEFSYVYDDLIDYIDVDNLPSNEYSLKVIQSMIDLYNNVKVSLILFF